MVPAQSVSNLVLSGLGEQVGVGQHWSGVDPEQVVMGMCRQITLHSEIRSSISRVQRSPSSGQVVGQLEAGSQVS